MNNSIDFKTLWAKAGNDSIPDSRELFEKAARLKRKTLMKIISCNVLLVLTAAFIIWVGVHYQSKVVTTWLGIILVIIAIALYVISSNNLVRLLFKNDPENDVHEYLNQMLLLKQKQEYLENTMLTLYFILLSAGLFLYMIEYTLRMSIGGLLLTYAITGAWIAFNWFYVKPKTINKQRAKLNTVIDKLQALNTQLMD